MSTNSLQGLGLSSDKPFLPRVNSMTASNLPLGDEGLTRNASSPSIASSSFSNFAKKAKAGRSKYHNLGHPGRHNSFSRSSNAFEIPVFFKRLLRPPTLDFETAMWEIFYLIIQPKRVYKSLYYHKQTKNRWARDDPSFVLLLTFFITISAVAWGLVYSPGALSILKLIGYMVVVDFLVTGIVIASIGWVLANCIFKNRHLVSASGVSDITSPFTDDSALEWPYCFDVHCNSYLVVWLCLYLIQFILLPLLTLSNWFSTLIGNTLYLFSLSYYFVITFYGYNALPFLSRTELILLPIPVLCVLWLVLTLLGFNVAAYLSDVYFN
ncbi:unnamed protein product [Kuraishia capsulata CBS 1993]|uniref:UNC-50 family protein n=1 Tax=Kuraishia capsulata CBS 1993 TaxID=1382522 RepID=W6MVJ1_9ASCO|nr:uncharacterized protein KUCA_T00002296001 [Kuraishia capsulata CBS 1993]CDK26325.1 unnamed protein product [Kuraishia capsulata CBS 1993]